nr:hypothetical protein [Tanacetum cinerariifolium]
MNARVAGLFLLDLLEYPNGKGVARVTSRGLDMALHWLRVGAAPLMSPRQDETRECHEPNSDGSGSAWNAYMNARVAVFLLVLLEYPNGKGVVRATSRGLNIALHWLGVEAAPLMSPKQDETSEPLLYAG